MDDLKEDCLSMAPHMEKLMTLLKHRNLSIFETRELKLEANNLVSLIDTRKVELKQRMEENHIEYLFRNIQTNEILQFSKLSSLLCSESTDDEEERLEILQDFHLVAGEFGATIKSLSSTVNVVNYQSKHKVILKELVIKTENSGRESKMVKNKIIEKELLCLKYIGAHDNILATFGYITSKNGNDEAVFKLVQEYLVFGDLQGLLYDKQLISAGYDIPWNVKLCWLKDITSAVTYLHNRQIIHGDIRAENVFIGSQFQVKLGNFHIATQIVSDEKVGYDSNVHICYLSPEVRLGEKLSTASDIFSFAMLAIFIFTRSHPQMNNFEQQISEALAANENSITNGSKQLKNLLLSCVQIEVDMTPGFLSLRPTASKIYKELSEMIDLIGGDYRLGLPAVLTIVPAVAVSTFSFPSFVSYPTSNYATKSSRSSKSSTGNGSKRLVKPSAGSPKAQQDSLQQLYDLCLKKQLGNSTTLVSARSDLGILKSVSPYSFGMYQCRSPDSGFSSRCSLNSLNDDVSSSVPSVTNDEHVNKGEAEEKGSYFLNDEDVYNKASTFVKVVSTFPTMEVASTIGGYPYDSKESILTFFREDLKFTQKHVVQYAEIFEQQNVINIYVLQQRIISNPDFLLQLGFDLDDALDVVEFLTKYFSGEINTRSTVFYQEVKDTSGQVQPSQLARLYYQASQENSVDALNKLKHFAEEGQELASGFLMRIYALGQVGLIKDMKEAENIAVRILPYLREMFIAINNDACIYACYLFGVCCSEGLGGVVKDPKEALQWYLRSAQRGYSGAQAYVGYCYFVGLGIEKNFTYALYWYKAAALQGYSAAQCNVGLCYEHGKGADKDFVEAVRWYQRSADQGDAAAQYNLGRCYEQGHETFPADISTAIKCYELSALQENAAAQYALALCYQRGKGFERNEEEAFKWFLASAKNAHPQAQFAVGECYDHGQGTEQNISMAIEYYTLSSFQNYPPALYQLGFCYTGGFGVESDSTIAATYYTKSADLGFAPAQNNLGVCYSQGNGVVKDYSQAVVWFTKSANQGYAPAQYNLGYCYERGRGAHRKLSDMLKWYRMAADQGDQRARVALDRVQRN